MRRFNRFQFPWNFAYLREQFIIFKFTFLTKVVRLDLILVIIKEMIPISTDLSTILSSNLSRICTWFPWICILSILIESLPNLFPINSSSQSFLLIIVKFRIVHRFIMSRLDHGITNYCLVLPLRRQLGMRSIHQIGFIVTSICTPALMTCILIQLFILF